MTERVRPETRAAVLRRDGQCLLFVIDRSHLCRDMFGQPHAPDDMGRLTIEHVRTDPGGMRRSDQWHLVAMCHEGNTQHAGSTTEARALLNAYLAGARAERYGR